MTGSSTLNLVSTMNVARSHCSIWATLTSRSHVPALNVMIGVIDILKEEKIETWDMR